MYEIQYVVESLVPVYFAAVFLLYYLLNDFPISVTIYPSHVCHHCILESSWQKFFRFGAAIHSVGQRLKVKVTGNMNIRLHSGKHPYFRLLSFLIFAS